MILIVQIKEHNFTEEILNAKLHFLCGVHCTEMLYMH